MTREEWGQEFARCWVCGWNGSHLNPLTTHEIARGSARAAALTEPAAWFRACMHCHMGELDSMPIARQLAYKLIHDSTRYDRIKVNELRHRAPDAITETEVAVEVSNLFVRRF